MYPFIFLLLRVQQSFSLVLSYLLISLWPLLLLTWHLSRSHWPITRISRYLLAGISSLRQVSLVPWWCIPWDARFLPSFGLCLFMTLRSIERNWWNLWRSLCFHFLWASIRLLWACCALVLRLSAKTLRHVSWLSGCRRRLWQVRQAAGRSQSFPNSLFGGWRPQWGQRYCVLAYWHFHQVTSLELVAYLCLHLQSQSATQRSCSF